MSLLPPFATIKILEIINICVQRVLNTVTYIYILTISNYQPDTVFYVLAAMLFTLSGGYSKCAECHVIYFKPMVLSFLSPALIISVAKLRERS